MVPNKTDLLRHHAVATELLHKYGLSVVPTYPDTKRPCVKWKQFQISQPTQAMIDSWFLPGRCPWDFLPGVGIVTGQISQEVVIDFDVNPGFSPEDLIAETEEYFSNLLGKPVKFPYTCIVRTGSGSYHYHYLTEPNARYRTFTKFFEGKSGHVEFRAEAHFTVMPPSSSDKGAYSYVTPLDTRTYIEGTWLIEAHTKLDIQRVHFSSDKIPDAPTQDQIEKVHRYLLERGRLSKTALDIIDGVKSTKDRSGLLFHLAAQLFRDGVENPYTIACVIAFSDQFYCKTTNRSDWWKWCWDTATKAITDEKSKRTVTTFQQTQQTEPEQQTQSLEFPNDCAVGICAEIAEMFAKRFEAPYSFWYNAALTCLGAAISGCVTIDSELNEQPRLYTVIIGPSATPRKSTAINKTVHFFEEALNDLDLFKKIPGLGSGEGLAKAIQRTDGKTSRCLILLDELKLFVQKARIDSSILLPMFASMYHTNNYSNATKKSIITVNNAHISILSACTEDTYANMWTQEFTSIGFLNRLWLVPDSPDKLIAIPETIPVEEKSTITSKLRSLIEEIINHTAITLETNKGDSAVLPFENPIKLKLTDESRLRWEKWYREERQKSIYSDRLDAIGFRLMILLEVSRSNLETIELDTVERVIKLLNWQFKVRQAYDPVDADNQMAKMEERIRRQLMTKGSMTERNLRRATGADRSGLWVFKTAINNLLEAEDIGFDVKHKLYYMKSKNDQIA